MKRKVNLKIKDIFSEEEKFLRWFSLSKNLKEAIKKILTAQRQVSKDTDDEDKPVIIQKKVIKKVNI